MKFLVKNKVLLTTGNSEISDKKQSFYNYQEFSGDFVSEILKFTIKMFSLVLENFKFPVLNHGKFVICRKERTDFEISDRRSEMSGIAPEKSNSLLEIVNFENE